jgi:hypothetical protein
VAFPTPLTAVSPAGSQVYTNSTPIGYINADNSPDTFTLSVNPGQTITVLATPTSSTLQPSVQLLDPNNTVIGTATAAAVNQDAVLETVATDNSTTGTYKIVVSGASSTIGGFSLQVYLNAALELEHLVPGVSNDTLATAQDLNGAFSNVTTAAGAQHAALVGATDPAAGYSATIPTYSFQNIASTGTTISFSSYDDGSTLITPAGFTFPFYGTNYTNMYVSTNGLITFGSANTEFLNENMTSDPTQAAIAPYWDDLYVTGATDSKVVYQVTGSGSSAQLIIQWNDISYYSDSTRTGGLTFEAILGANGSIRFNYQSLANGHNSGANDNGVSATVGIKAAGTVTGSNLLVLDFDATPTGWNNYVKNLNSVLITNNLSTGDYYSFSVARAETDTFTLANVSAGSLSLALYNSSGTLLASGVGGATNLAQVVNNYNFTAAGTYYLFVTGAPSVSYDLGITRGATFETEPNNTVATAENITGDSGVVGDITSATDSDWYSISANSGAVLTLATSTPSSGSGQFTDTLSPHIQLYDPTGSTLLASGAVGSDGRNEALAYVVNAAGAYKVHVTSKSSTYGEYFLTLVAQLALLAPANMTEGDPPATATLSIPAPWPATCWSILPPAILRGSPYPPARPFPMDRRRSPSR